MIHLLENRKAKFEYEILEKYEAGVVLVGSEVKSLLANRGNLTGAFCKFFKDELFLFDMTISSINTTFNIFHNDKRERKLLLKRRELDKLQSSLIDGLTIIPLSVYYSDTNKIKINIGLCKGRKLHDKREYIKERDMLKEAREY
jgi:SsrA-binding protein